MRAVIESLDPSSWKAHALHAQDRLWPETNCYTDLWIEILNARGLDPRAMLGFTLTQDFEGDQFTFFKVPLEDLETLYSIRVTELAIFDDLLGHIENQIARGAMPLVEVDSYYLPDTRGVSYKVQHQKTTIGINAVDSDAGCMDYFHNAGFCRVEGDDFRGLMQLLPDQKRPDVLFPYTEFAKFPEHDHTPSMDKVMGVFERHLRRRPPGNPVRAYADQLDEHMESVRRREDGYFHIYAFNTIRQLGANSELLASHLAWIGGTGVLSLDRSVKAALAIAGGAKVLQFQLARALKRGNFSKLHETLGPMADAWDTLTHDLHHVCGPLKSAA